MPHAHELTDHSGTKGTETSHTVVISTLTSFSLKSTKHGECAFKCFELATSVTFLK